MPKKLNKESIRIIKQITIDMDPCAARGLLLVFANGIEEGHRLDVIVEDMADEARKELEG